MSNSPTHGKSTVLKANTKDISAWTNTSDFKYAADRHESTGYGAVGHEYADGVGLKAHGFKCGGTYDITATTGTAAVFQGKEGTMVGFVRRIQGTGTGKPEETFNAILDDFTPSSPFNDIVRWTANFTVSGDVAYTTQ